ncbi:uncharacterized protein LOC124537752 [Vanessa cardui]|uniref:uncharacterized protein LOC124537752 n=1 Tax=Vanessa cardui TaxID=171605 RepID=UPI001F14117F|nr:uncharacterized protein LOC124537752 [Vanessa cardui]
MIAVAECKSGAPVETTATKYGLPYATLYRHMKSGSSSAQLGRFRKVFTDAQEADLQEYLREMDSVFYGLTREDFKKLVYVYAKKNNLARPPSWDKNEKAGDDWLAGFLGRNPSICLRVPEATSVARVKGFNRPQVERFYELLSEQVEKHKIDGSRIYNVDETGIQTSTNKPPKVLSTKGKKQVGVIASTERGQTTTIVCCCNASGSFIPPFMIFARKRMQDRLLDGSPPETQGTCSPSGWINGEIFLEWIRFFTYHVRPTAERKVLLILDNHESHKFYPALEYASQNHVILLSLPPHTSNKLQPLDVAVYGPLKIFFEQEINRFQKAHPGRIVNQYDVARLFTPAYLKCATANNAVKDYAPSSTSLCDRNVANQDDGLQTLANQDNSELPSTSRKRAQHEAVETNQSVTLHEVDDETSTEVDKSSGPNSEPPARQEVSLESNIQGSSRGPSTSNLVAFEMAVDAERSSTLSLRKFRKENKTSNSSKVSMPELDKATLVPSTPEKIGPEKDDSTKDEDVVLKRDCALPTEIISLPEFIDSTTTSIVDLNELDPLQSMMDEENDSCMEKGPEPSASAIYFSPKEIKPLPTPCVPMRRFQFRRLVPNCCSPGIVLRTGGYDFSYKMFRRKVVRQQCGARPLAARQQPVSVVVR